MTTSTLLAGSHLVPPEMRRPIGELAARAAANLGALIEDEASVLRQHMVQLTSPPQALGDSAQPKPQRLVVHGRTEADSFVDDNQELRYVASVAWDGTSGYTPATPATPGPLQQLADYELVVESTERLDSRTVSGSFAALVPTIPSFILAFVRSVVAQFGTPGMTTEALMDLYGTITPSLRAVTNSLVHVDKVRLVRALDADVTEVDVELHLDLIEMQRLYGGLANFLTWVSDLTCDVYEGTPRNGRTQRWRVGSARYNQNIFTLRAFIQRGEVLWIDPATNLPARVTVTGAYYPVAFDIYGREHFHVRANLTVAMLSLGPLVVASMTLPYVNAEIHYEGSNLANSDGRASGETAVCRAQVSDVGSLFYLYELLVPMDRIRVMLKELCQCKIILVPESLHRQGSHNAKPVEKPTNVANETSLAEATAQDTGGSTASENYIFVIRGTLSFPRSLILDTLQDIMGWLGNSPIMLHLLAGAHALAQALATDFLSASASPVPAGEN